MKMANVINFRVDEKEQDFQIRIDKYIPRTIISDEQRLSQVVANLLSNAVKFTPPKGSITLNARKMSEISGSCILRIDVTDTGIGMNGEQKGRMFQSFSQADSSTSRKFGGTGLGLAISTRIVEMMHGEIWVTSEEGKGSTFSFTVRVERGQDAQLAPSLLNLGVNWSNVRVLMVDDSADIRDYFRDISERLGFKCDLAGDGFEALDMIAKQGAYDVYFVDWKMPGMDGIELTRRILADKTGNAAVVMITSADRELVEKEAGEAGVNRFLSKPLFSSAIADCINECLGMQAAGAQDGAEATQELEGCFEGCSMLLVEDTDINREIVLTVLEPSRLLIECAENGKQALEMFDRAPERYDIIFMDIHMPEMDGYESTRAVRALPHPRAKTIPIVAMTANVFREDVEKCLEAGMNDHIGKPVDFDVMVEKLRKYLPRTPRKVANDAQ
jgi:CheY-like chemotaxis protein